MTSRPDPRGLTEDQIEAAIAFLATAPKNVGSWAEGQSAVLKEQLADLQDEPDCFYDDFEDEDDVLSRHKTREDIAGGEPEKMTKGFKLVLVAVLAVGLVVGVWLAGRPAGTEVASQQAGPPTMGSSQMGSDQMGSEEMAAAQADRLIELEQVVEEDPTDLDARLELGALYFDKGWLNEAEAQWQAVADADPENVMAWYNLGFVYLSADPPNTEKTMEVWEKVTEIDPDSDLAETILTHIGGLKVDEAGGVHSPDEKDESK